MLLGNLFRDQLDRYGELETIADRWAGGRGGARPRRARAQRRRPARRRPRPGPRRHLLRRRGRLARPARAPARVGLQALPPLRPRLRLRGRSTSPTSAATAAPTAARSAPRPPSRPRTSSCTASARPRSRCSGAARRAPAPRPLQRLQRARRRRAHALRSASRWTTSSAGLQAVAPAFGRAETLDLGGRPTSILLVKNPAGANEVLRTLALEGGELDLLGVLNDRTADGRDVSWVWDADWELLAPQRAPDDLLGHARGRAGAAHEVRRAADRSASGSSTSLEPGSTRRCATATARCTPSPPTRRCWSCASCSTRRGQAEAYWR